MRIGIDISQIVHEGTGVARFTKGLVNTILEYDIKNQWLFFFSSLRKNLDEQLEKKILAKNHQLIKWKLPPTVLAYLFNDIHSPLISKFLNFSISLDWFITSDWTEPPLKINKATIVHDLAYLRYPETVIKKIRQTQKKRLIWVKKESSIIFADSYETKKDLTNFLKIDPNRIVVNYPGVSTYKINKVKINEILKKFNLKKNQFILTVGKLEPRKNLKRLIEAYQKSAKNNIQLIIVGPKGWEDLKNITLNIKYLGYVTDEDLAALYSSCLFFIYPSIWEGFGYPVIEAMKYHVPVACSNVSPIKEIAGNAALFFNPYNIDEMTQCIDRLSRNEKLRNELIKKGEKRSKIFDWKNYYDKMIITLKSLIV